MSNSGCNHRGISLSNTIHSEVAPCLPLPSLPVFCGALDQELRLFDEPTSARPSNRSEVLAQASKIADLLRETDVSYLNLKDNSGPLPYSFVEPLALCDEVLRFNSEAFEYVSPGPIKEQISSSSTTFEKKPFMQTVPITSQAQRESGGVHTHNLDYSLVKDTPTRKPKVKKKASEDTSYSTIVDPVELRDATIGDFCEVLNDFCGRAEISSDDRDEIEWLSLSVADVRTLVNEIVSVRPKNVLHLVPIDILMRLLKVLNHQIHRAEGLSVSECDHSDSDVVSVVFCALESIHAALAIMVNKDMPKLLYKEEVIERIMEFCRHQIMDVMAACDPSYRALHKPSENGIVEDEEDEEADADFGSANKRRRISKSSKVKKSAGNSVSSAVNNILQKLCTILGFIKDLLLTERLSDSCILQLVKTSFTTFLVDNIQLLQLKSISLISGIFYSYVHHRPYVIDETHQLLWKLPFSKRVSRAYHLPDEEQRQIQMVTALLIQLIHCSANLPEGLRHDSNSNTLLEVSIDTSYPIKCNEAVTESCCLFWSHVLQRLSSVKSQDASEFRGIMENLVMDLLATLNLPEYPASAPILEVLCVLLLQNAGLKSKDTYARTMAIDLLGTIAARLKQDAVRCSSSHFWILQELVGGDNVRHSYPKDACSVCLDGKVEKKLFFCQGCQRLFHASCMGVREHEVPSRGWYCQFCLCMKQLLVLESYCKSQCKDDGKKNHTLLEKTSDANNPITKWEIVQQMLLNYLQDSCSADHAHIFARWFYLCLWYKDDPRSRDKFTYYLAKLKSKAIVRDSGAVSSLLTRDSVKKITLALGQKNSFSRGFDKILHLLLASLRENSPVIRAKALRAVSIIVEADPEVLGEKRVQVAVEGRFCDSAISVREAALELVGRHIASHPDVGLKYFEKVAERIKDTGVSVRKRAIKIVKDMCTSNVNLEFTRACVEIISRVNDEESSIQDLVCKTFYEFWFEEPPGSRTQYFGDGSSVPLEVAKKTEQIVEVLRQMPSHQLLVTVIKRNLALDFLPQSTKAAGINPALLASIRKRCELMCKFLLERILQVEEMTNEDVEMRALPYVLVLHAFCVVDPTLCAPSSDPSQFVITLQPYLKSQVDNRIVAKLLESIICVIDAVLPLLRKLPQSVVEELEQDLKHMIVRHSFLTVVHACIRCLCSLTKVAGKGASVVECLIQVFFKRLDALAVDNKQQVGRSLFCLGLLIRYGNPLLTTSSNKNVDLISSISLFKKYLYGEDFVVKVRALQALGYVLIARPEYMLEKDVRNILEATLSSGADVRLKIQALQNMYEYLLDAESQLEVDTASKDDVVQYTAEGGNTVPVAAGAGDTNICGGIVQLYWNSLLERCLDMSEQVRQSALKIVEVVLRQGLVHPITCVPFLIALETDPQEVNSKLAHHLLMNMNEKYPAFFESRLGDGLQLSFIFIHSIAGSSQNSDSRFHTKASVNINGKSDGGSFSYARLGVSRIYKLIRGNRVSRNKFMSSVVRKFDSPSWNHSVIPFLMYCTEILALLPFTSPDEPLYLIYTINRVIQVRAGVLEANLKAMSVHLLQRDALKVPHENGINHQEITPQAVSYHCTVIDANGTILQDPAGQPGWRHSTSSDDNVRMKIDYSCSVGEDYLQKIQADCLAATALQLLLKLKRHLKVVYSLDDARCQVYSPNEPVKPGEGFIKQNVALHYGEIHTTLPTTYQEFIQRYQEFKNALKEDTVDYSTYTTNIKRKRPTPRKVGRNRRLTDRDNEDTSDEDWAGGSKRLSNSGGRSRGARQRL